MRVSIPGTVTSIGHNAFKGCSYLVSVKNSSSVILRTAHGFSSFQLFTQTEVIGSNVTRIPDNCFELDMSEEQIIDLKSRMLEQDEEGYLMIRQYSQIYNHESYNMRHLQIPPSVTHIGENAFKNCFNLASVNIPKHVVHVGNNAFDNCFNLREGATGNMWRTINGNYNKNDPNIAEAHAEAVLHGKIIAEANQERTIWHAGQPNPKNLNDTLGTRWGLDRFNGLRGIMNSSSYTIEEIKTMANIPLFGSDVETVIFIQPKIAEVSGLPEGLRFDEESGRIVGTSQTSGNVNATVVMKDTISGKVISTSQINVVTVKSDKINDLIVEVTNICGENGLKVAASSKLSDKYLFDGVPFPNVIKGGQQLNLGYTQKEDNVFGIEGLSSSTSINQINEVSLGTKGIWKDGDGNYNLSMGKGFKICNRLQVSQTFSLKDKRGNGISLTGGGRVAGNAGKAFQAKVGNGQAFFKAGPKHFKVGFNEDTDQLTIGAGIGLGQLGMLGGVNVSFELTVDLSLYGVQDTMDTLEFTEVLGSAVYGETLGSFLEKVDQMVNEPIVHFDNFMYWQNPADAEGLSFISWVEGLPISVDDVVWTAASFFVEFATAGAVELEIAMDDFIDLDRYPHYANIIVGYPNGYRLFLRPLHLYNNLGFPELPQPNTVINALNPPRTDSLHDPLLRY
jgi:hypothetical protein